jgi:DNA topoisomerase-3
VKTLVIAEKPSVGRDIGRVLKCAQKGEGYIYSETHIVSWAIGHLVTLAEPEEYDPALKRWRFDALPIIPEAMKLAPVAKTKKQLTILKKLMRSKDVSEIICATDSGREGELIFRYIYQITGCAKPFKRLWISSMTDESIKKGFSNLKDGSCYNKLYESARCRSEADWLVGMNASRAFTLKYNTLLSVGRVQTPTLAIIAERQTEINQFVPKDYWEVSAEFKCLSTIAEGTPAAQADGSTGCLSQQPATTYSGLWFEPKTKDSKIFDKAKALDIIKKVKGQIGAIIDVTTERKKIPPPLLYDLTELQRDANKRFGLTAKKTLAIAQDLYEKRKLITYPRTDSRYLSSDMVSKLTAILKKLAYDPYSPFVSYVLGLPELPINRRIIDDSKITDHFAIIPTNTTVNHKKLSPDEAKILDLITRRFISVFYPPYIYDVTTVITSVNSENFISKGSVVIQLGWIELNPQDDLIALPLLKKDEAVAVTKASIQAKKTQPPKPYTEATLLSAMEHAGRFVDNEELAAKLKESGLGTPATRAGVIERLLTVGYIVRKSKALIPTEKGMKLIEAAPAELKSPETTGRWEKGLESIAKDKLNPDRFMESIIRYVKYIISFTAASEQSITFAPDKPKTHKKSFGQCPLCGAGQILENSKAFYCSRWREGCAYNKWKTT